MNPLDWSLLAGPLPVILLAGALLALGWLVAGGNAPGRGWLRRWLRRGARGGGAGGAPSVRWLAVWVPLIVVAAAGIIALVTWLINNVWRPFPDLLPFPVVLGVVALVACCWRSPGLLRGPGRGGPPRSPQASWCWPPPPARSRLPGGSSLRAALEWLDQAVFTGTVREAGRRRAGAGAGRHLGSAARDAGGRCGVPGGYSRGHVRVQGTAGLHLPAARLPDRAAAAASGAGAAGRAAGGSAQLGRLGPGPGDHGRFREGHDGLARSW